MVRTRSQTHRLSSESRSPEPKRVRTDDEYLHEVVQEDRKTFEDSSIDGTPIEDPIESIIFTLETSMHSGKCPMIIFDYILNIPENLPNVFDCTKILSKK
jgi:hypothetical protein